MLLPFWLLGAHKVHGIHIHALQKVIQLRIGQGFVHVPHDFVGDVFSFQPSERFTAFSAAWIVVNFSGHEG